METRRANLVSVIIPAYNAELYLAEAIESVLAQTYRTVELIVVDDGSTDNTALIAKKFADSVRLIHQTNQGLSAARNAGIRSAQGEIIALLDADDLWESCFLEVMVSALEQNPQLIGAYCGFQYINAEGSIVGRPSLRVVAPEVFHETLLYNGNWLAPSGVIFRKSVAFEVGLFDEEIGPVADTDLWIKLSSRGPLIGLPQPLIKYRQHDGNMSKDPQRMITASRRLTEKVFGPAEGDVLSWPKLKRIAYRNHYWSAAIRYLRAGNFEKSADSLRQLAVISFEFLLSIDLWRGLAHAHIPYEYQFDLSYKLKWEKMQSDIVILLDELDNELDGQNDIQKKYARIKAAAFLALADEAGRAGKLGQAFQWLWVATRAFSPLWLDRRLWGTIIRSLTGKMNSTFLHG
jgi:glycosyltransferase involved in cell wall biosynthesis